MIDVSICMITYNKLPFLQRSINTIIESIDSSLKVQFLVWDNGSDDGTKDYLRSVSVPPNVVYELYGSRSNIGLNAYGLLAEHADGNIIVTADDDIFEIEPLGWERRFMRVLGCTFNGERFGYIGADTINSDGGRVYDSWGVATVGDLSIQIGVVGGWFSATPRRVYDAVGGFHTGMPKMYLEDTDYQKRVWQNGYLCGTLLNTMVLHACHPRYYEELGRVETYNEKSRLAADVGISLPTLT